MMRRSYRRRRTRTSSAGRIGWPTPTRALMEWIGNWYLIYRTPAELQRLATAAGIPSEYARIGAERLGIDLFLCADRWSPGFSRS